jgi:2-oxoglutarate ferredoxin oxidoreductase subunit alpha
LTYPGLSEPLVKVIPTNIRKREKLRKILNLRVRMVDKRLRKGSLLEEEAVPPALFGERNAGVYLVCWGSNKETVRRRPPGCSPRGVPCAALHFSQVYPLTPVMIENIPS